MILKMIKIWNFYSKIVERWYTSVPMASSLDVGTMAPNDHNLYQFIREHLDILFDCDQAEANSDLFGRVGLKFQPTDVSLNNAERTSTIP